MKAIISVIGKDKVGILAWVANKCADANVNILNVSQTIVDGIFTMTMSVDFQNDTQNLPEFAAMMEEAGKEKDLIIRVMHEDIFNSMHRI